jgi:CRISPR/Cas system CSM-associated protein Csm3 (group 7 of RAMP superfamily)
MGLSSEHPFDLKLGGGKNRGLGSIRFSVTEPIKLFPTPKAAYQSFSSSPEEKQIDDWGKEATQAYRSSCSTAEGERIKELITDFGRLNDEENEEGAPNDE